MSTIVFALFRACSTLPENQKFVASDIKDIETVDIIIAGKKS